MMTLKVLNTHQEIDLRTFKKSIIRLISNKTEQTHPPKKKGYFYVYLFFQ